MQPQPYFSGFAPIPAEAEPRLMPDAQPLYLQPNSDGNAVVVCVHGFTGTPYEVAPAARAIAKLGIAAVAPLLPGHGYQHREEQKREFARITPAGMLAAVREEISKARQRYARVGLLGFSMGGAIALRMAAESLVDCCVAVAPALRLPPQGEILIPLLSWASFTLPAVPKDPFYIPCYDFHHSHALRTLWQLSRYARSGLPKISCPVLGIHSHNDLTVLPVVLPLMQAQIPVPIETAWFDGSGHVMLLDKSGAAVAQTVAEFFQRQLSTGKGV
ncbi:alpha/beta fold hydrolase [Nodosilinea sp. LEGE 07088]|uniref:alpha/beta hydrolase n=1 Tax=Nodosilinea sp. LEGE 07088 TaxID=2777968 RepID=UPI001880F18C|nr:alpha/beta fold hydrolase [Nodosilinea sp. LEGE 07088]MBE9140906.1 alpha/beta fold hydrolase [Nodosilinea sp. LEGE 07088]